MTGPSSISRPSTSPLTNTDAASSSTSADNKAFTTSVAQSGPKADASLGGLPTMNGGGAKRASFAASKPADGTQGTQGTQSTQASKPSKFGKLEQVASEAMKDTTGLMSVAENALSGYLQFKQAETSAIAELMKNGAKNVEEASKG
jgi:hypothetical protein